MFVIIHVQLEIFCKNLTLIDINKILYDLLLHCIALPYFLHCDPPVTSEKNVSLFIKGSHSVFPLKTPSCLPVPFATDLPPPTRGHTQSWDVLLRWGSSNLIHGHPRELRLTFLNCLLPSRGVIWTSFHRFLRRIIWVL